MTDESHAIGARRAVPAAPPGLVRDPHVVASFLTDAAHVGGGFAEGVAMPRTEADVAALAASGARILAVGAQSSLTGGATPRGEVVLSTRHLTRLAIGHGRVRAGAGVRLHDVQQALAASGQWYPPVPTWDGATVGGTIATNAAGAATFKYGATRPWVEALTIVLAGGDVLDLRRGAVTASPDGRFVVRPVTGAPIDVPMPPIRMPDVPKLSAGYWGRPGMDLIDLFIGAEGTLGVIVEAELRVAPRPLRVVAIVTCDGDAQALAVTARLRDEARAAWRGEGPLDVAAIEYLDARGLALVGDEVFAQSGVRRPAGDRVLLVVQCEIPEDETRALERLLEVLDACGVAEDPSVAGAGDERGAQRIFHLREAVPAAVNAAVARAKQADPAIEKTAADFIVPFERLAEAIARYRGACAARGLDVAIWGHVSDGNLHPNILPASFEDVRQGREAILELGEAVIAMGGAPLAEHGVGRSVLKQQLLRRLYGDAGIEAMRAVKRALDPRWTLAPGVLFPAAAANPETPPDGRIRTAG